MADALPAISEEEILKIFSTGEKVEKTPRGAKPPEQNANGQKSSEQNASEKKKKKKGKK